MNIAVVAQNFDAGYRSDEPRDQLPKGAAYRMKDWIPQLNAPLDKRGGWEISADSLGTRAAGVGWAPFPGDPHLLIVTVDGKGWSDRLFNGGGGGGVGDTLFGTAVTHAPFWHRDRMILPCPLGLAGGKAPAHYISGAIGALPGSPPLAAVGASWGDYLILANGYVSGTRYSNRLWISGVGDPTSWNTGTGFFDVPAEVLRIVPIRSSILVFGYTDVWMISGDTPPPGGNWSRSNLFSAIGCMDGRSVATYQSFVVWANNAGIYRSDGYSLADLTQLGGIKQRWQELVGNFDFLAGWSAAAGIYGDYYFIVVHDQNGNFVTCQVCDLTRDIWFEFTNVPAAMFAQRASGPGTATVSGSQELFFAHRVLPLAGKLSPCWFASDANDGDGTAVQPQLESPFWKLGAPNKKQIRRGRFTYDLRSAGASPYIQVEYATEPQENAPYTLLSGTLPVTTTLSRQSVEIRQRAYGIGLRLTQVGASAATRLEEIEAEAQVLEAVR